MLLVLGNACKDITFQVAALPVPGETLVARGTVSGLGGKGLNQAVAAARSGAQVRLVAAIGDDDAAAAIRAALGAENMIDEGLVSKSGETDLSAIIVDAGGENMIVTRSAQAARLAVEDLETHVSFAYGDVLLLQGNLSAAISAAAAELAKAAGAKVVFNPAPYRDWCKTIARNVDVLILNAVEAERWSGAVGWDRAIAALDLPVAIVTCGAEGCFMKRGRSPAEHFAAPPVKVEDATGAGDVFTGVFAAYWAQDGDASAAVRLATMAASDSATRRGAFASIPGREALSRMRSESA